MSYHSKITDLYGVDLYKLCGPKADRKPWTSFSSQERRARLNKIPVYIPTRSLGKYPKLVDVVIHCFDKLVQLGEDNPLWGVDLPEFTSLVQAAELNNVPAMNYGKELLQTIDNLYKNAYKQRDVFLRHIFEDIVFRFDAGLVFPGIGRKDSKGRIFVNDAQHRTLACIILGIEEVPIAFIHSDNEYWDVAQYAAINIHSLSASEFDRYRIRVQRQIEAEEAGMPVDPDDALCFELHQLFDNLGIIVAEKGDNAPNGSTGLVLNSIGNMINYRETYKKDHFTRATEMNAIMFPTCKFQTANSWGLMEFLKTQDKNINPLVMDRAIQHALKKCWARPNAGAAMHKSIKDCYKAATKVNATQSRVPEPVIIAEGIYQICKHYSPEINWTSPKWPTDVPKFSYPLI
jgi:hypothetical protein